ncbi:MAG: AAA family ATPase [Gammaproteobacteria bacterium]|jgi:lon-related putative ATP-dependent protease|nr:AAA family ATPase [Gammaproteobacteria bacterium]
MDQPLRHPAELDAAALRHSCDPAQFDFQSTADLAPIPVTVGQDRALEAIRFGTGIAHEGYNLYVMGSTGLGRHTAVRESLQSLASARPPPADWVYVADFDRPHRPNALCLPAGRGKRLRHDLEQLVEDLLNALPTALQSDEYRRRAQEITDEFKHREETAAEELGRKAHERSIALLHTPTGYSLAPLREGHLVNPEEFGLLPEDAQERLRAAMEATKEELASALSRIPLWQREMRQRFQELEREVARLTVSQLLHDLEQRYADLPEVLGYLAAVRADVIENNELFRPGGDGSAVDADDGRFTRYRVNLLVDNGDANGAPIVYEDNPSYQNLIGRIEHVARLGTLTTDFTQIKPGVLHRANGGFLLLDAAKVLTSPFAWDGLKRALTAREVRIESLERLLSLAATTSLEPEPIPIELKVVLIGDRLLYYLLKAYDPEFSLLFKVTADFSEDLSRGPDTDVLYARLVATLQQRERLRPIDRAGVARIVEEAARRVEDGERLSLHIGRLLDIVREADHVAAGAGSALVGAAHVQAAIEAQDRRLGRARERVQEEILRGTLMIDTHGVQLGQVNGLSVLQLGDYAFGAPTRISATARLGSGDVVDIEREVNQGGEIHTKGVLILASYLASRYARHQPLSLAASLAFEQTYGEVEGDSASVAELCALLSAIGDVPLRQAVAVTGSVNQHGQVQAVGGLNEKIEGFFDICRARGLDGSQGVILPAANVSHLMLRPDVVEAAAAGRFHLYAVRHVDEAMELLTGSRPGHPDAHGLYPEDSFNGRVQRRLIEWTALRQQYGQPQGGNPG